MCYSKALQGNLNRGAILKLKSLGVKNYFYEIIYMENNIWNNICEISTINRNYKEIFKVESKNVKLNIM